MPLPQSLRSAPAEWTEALTHLSLVLANGVVGKEMSQRPITLMHVE